MPTSPLNLPQQFGRFLAAGALVFVALFWCACAILLSTQEAHQDLAALHAMLKSGALQSLAGWLLNLQTGYVPFFLRQRPLPMAYGIAVLPAWLAAFVYDVKILRKENLL